MKHGWIYQPWPIAKYDYYLRSRIMLSDLKIETLFLLHLALFSYIFLLYCGLVFTLRFFKFHTSVILDVSLMLLKSMMSRFYAPTFL